MNKLLKRLPLFVAEYKEIKQITNAEIPELNKMIGEINSVKNNQFITACDENGIARFEKLLNITPSEYDTLESRISRVLIRWNDVVPYSWRVFLNKIISICGNNFEVYPDWDNYQLEIRTRLELFGQTDELENVIKYMIPANIEVSAKNQIDCTLNGSAYIAAGMAFCDVFELSENSNANCKIDGKLGAAAIGSGTCEITLTDTYSGVVSLENNIRSAELPIIAEIIEI